MSKTYRLSGLILAAIFVVAGCAPAAQPTSAPAEPTADVDAAVQKTVVVMETKMSADLTQQAPLATATLADTDTPVPSVPTFPPTPTNFVVIFPATISSSDGGGGGGADPVQQKYQCGLVSQSPVNGSSISPKTDFDAIWTVQNTGWKMWETSEVDYYYVSGQKMQQHEDLYDLPNPVGSGKTIKLKVDMGAPKTPGTYATYWALKVGGQPFCNFSMIIKVN